MLLKGKCPPDIPQLLGGLLELNRHGRLDLAGQRIKFLNLATASESEQGSITHSGRKLGWCQSTPGGIFVIMLMSC